MTAGGNKPRYPRISKQNSVSAQQLNFRSGQIRRNSIRQRCRRSGRQVPAAAARRAHAAPLPSRAASSDKLQRTCINAPSLAAAALESARSRPCLNCIATGCAALHLYSFWLPLLLSSVANSSHLSSHISCRCADVRALGFDAAIDYTQFTESANAEAEFRSKLKEHAPDGIDMYARAPCCCAAAACRRAAGDVCSTAASLTVSCVRCRYFENVGGFQFQAAFNSLRKHGRIAVCGR